MSAGVGVPWRLFLSVVSLLLISCSNEDVTSRVEKGVLDLRHLEQGDDFSVRMNGEWEFWFGTFIYGSPGDISDTLVPDLYGKVPGYWSEYTLDGSRLPRFGYGTYRTLILLPSGYRDRMGFDMPVFDTSYEISINGVTMARNGTPARSSAESVPSYEPLFFSYVPKSDTLEILIRVSNYEHRRGGFWMPMKTGSFKAIQTNFTNQWFISIAVSGMLFASFLFFLIFYLLDRRDRKLLMFSLLVLCLALRPFLSAPYLITIVDVRHWHLIIRGEYLILLFMITSGAWLAYLIYPTRWFRRFAIAIDVIFLFGIAAIILLPIYLFSYSVWIIQASAVLVLLYAIFMSIRGVATGNRIDVLYLIAFMTIAIGLVSDILFSNALEENQRLYILSFTMLAFVFIQATLLIRGWVRRGQERERLAAQLEELNRDLENRVKRRTAELQERSDELRNRNEHIARQNRKLSETINLKNKIFSVISHDLRSPVVNILYTLYMLKEEEFRERTELMADACIQSSQQLITLLENMLVWGRGQEDMIRYAPAEHDLADLILTNISILKDGADRKDISLNFTQVGKAKGWFDRDLIDIVIRNLLSNAIKYTNHGGRVTIVVRQKEEASDWVTISICDNGIGISPERQKRLFTESELESTPGTDSEKGTGIGLRLVHELVTLSKGTITVESTPGSGSCFTVMLPATGHTKKGRGRLHQTS
ncbi:MAG: sensor histidine kinase [Bacteroidales bacterium]|nr:sensor histidine kinase [Bacteroidales bacterium]HOO65288.1 sensor histidine kinase [Bacteroidales bacterium]HPE21420.1 sensor histidine kinase [Bacteroidales bacterium]HPJ04293.1 sensor histidine kinase [Bacteroidales bacterium]HPQ62834.1 sensor histidine kinase [Bacteroidales bacterium]